MRVVFFGTPIFAARILEYLIEKKIDIVGVVTQTDKEKESGAVKKIAIEKLHVEIFQPESAKDPHFLEQMKKLLPDLFIVVAYGKILPQSLLDIPTLDAINIHASLLPKYRGAAPMQRALMNGEEKSGVTIMKMVKEMDAGDIIAYDEIKIDPKMNFQELHDHMCEIAKSLILQVIDLYDKKKVVTIPQDSSKVTFAPKITFEDLILHFDKDAKNLYDQIRAFSPSPGARFLIQINDQRKYLKILEAEILPLDGKIGDVKLDKKDFIIFCKKGSLRLLKVQLEGKKIMSAEEFMRGVKASIKIV